MSKDLAAQNSGFLALSNTDVGELMREELDGLTLTFEKVKIPSAGATSFELEGEDGENESVKEVKAVILFHHTLYAYYKTKYTGGNNPPDCGSFDGVTGIGDPGGDCKRCPYNQFGTADNNAKACKNRRRIYILREGELFPLLLSLPTGSLKEFTKYLKRLLAKGRKSNSVVTKLTLQKAANANGMAYSKAQFSVDRVLTDEEQILIDRLTGQIKEMAGQVSFDADAPINVDLETGEVIEPLN